MSSAARSVAGGHGRAAERIGGDVSEPRSGCGGAIGKLITSAVFLAFVVIGSVFVVIVAREVKLEVEVFSWHPTPAVVTSSRVEETDHDEPYRPAVRYRYRAAGQERIGDRITRRPLASGHYDVAARAAAGYPEDAEVVCYVDPADPAAAVLERRVPWFGLFVLLPLVFVAVGGIGLYVVWLRRPPPEPATVSISRRAHGQRRARLVPVVLGWLFVAVGASLFVALGLLPVLRIAQARGWTETPCEIISSTVRSRSTDDGTSYRIDILYEYSFGGRSWRSNRYDFANFSSSGYRSKREVADRYPAGTRTVCFVAAADPFRAVLVRDFRPAYLVGLFPLIFLLAGAAVLRWGTVRDRRAAAVPPHRRIAAADRSAATVGPLTLEAARGRVGKVVGSIVFTMIWNGVVGVFLWRLVTDWQHGRHDFITVIFLVPFVLVGLFAIGLVVYFALGLANPRPTITLDHAPLHLGERVHVGWRFSGRAERIDRLRLTLEGREEATYQRGTDSHTDREVFAVITVYDGPAGLGDGSGSADLAVPPDTMHSFAAANNRIVWSIKVAGEIARWPDVDDTFDVEILPAPAGGPGW